MTEENEAPEATSFCQEATVFTSLPVIHFPGGSILQPQVDPTHGSPSSCGFSLDLTGNLQAALAPFQPFLTVIDCVATLGQVTLLAVEVIGGNTLKIPQLISLTIGLVAKINAVLALVPSLPPAFREYFTFVVDIIRFAGVQLDCLLQILESVKDQFVELNRLAEQINDTDDEDIRNNLQALFDCGKKNAEDQTANSLGILGPIARIVCIARTTLALTGDDGKRIAKLIAFPDPSNIENLETAILAIRLGRDILLTFVQVIEALALGFGGLLPAPPVVFVCPLDEDQEEDEAVLQPIVESTRDATTQTPIPPGTIPSGAAFTIQILGINFNVKSSVYWSTSRIPSASVDLLSDTLLQATIPAELLANPGVFTISVANEPEKQSPFDGLPSSAGDLGISQNKVSNLFEVEVV